MNLTPLYDRVIVRPSEPEEVTKGGIIIPDTAKEKPMQGEVVAVGNGKVTEDGKVLPLSVKVGDKVLYGKYAGTEIKIDGEDFLIMRESDIFAIINK
ncbi:MAG: co-chaperone GroES [Chlorobiota bacterium]|jgi:chaperonin GroES|nr:MAG: co-chaperone GroES [Chlorobiota bacterium]